MRLAAPASVLAPLLLAVFVAGACTGGPSDDMFDGDGGAGDARAEAGGDAGAGEAGRDAASARCEGACATTALAATFGANSGAFDRAQHGVEQSGGRPLFYVEAHFGGDPACPSDTSPAPDRTMVLANVPAGEAGEVFTKSDGVTAAVLDFSGDLSLPPTTSATAVEVTLVAVDGASPPAFVAFDVTATFAQGTLTGHGYATYCASLSR